MSSDTQDQDALVHVRAARMGRVDAEADFTAAIVAASAAGHSCRSIAKAAGLSFQRVAQIVQQEQAPQAVGASGQPRA
jgi:K+-transporting ATPase c subunit